MRKCKICDNQEAVYAMQYIADDSPSFYTLGSHVRGFSVIPVCSDCAAERKYIAGQIKEFLCGIPVEASVRMARKLEQTRLDLLRAKMAGKGQA